MIVAMLVLGIGIAGGVVAISSNASLNAASRDTTVLALLAQRRLVEADNEAILNEAYSEGTEEGDFGEDYPDYQWEQLVETTDVTDLYQITIHVVHNTGTHERSFDLTTLRLAPPISQEETGTETDTTTGGAPTAAPAGGTNG